MGKDRVAASWAHARHADKTVNATLVLGVVAVIDFSYSGIFVSETASP